MIRSLRILLAALLIASIGCDRDAGTSDPSARLTSGWNNYRVGEFGQAIKDFEAARSSGDPDQQRQAIYALATTWNLRRPSENPVLARSLYQQVIAEKQDTLSTWSELALVRMDHLVPVGEQPNYEKVRQGYQQIIDRHPDHMAAQEAFIFQQSTLLATLNEADATGCLVSLNAFLEKYPSSPYRSAVYSLIARAHSTLKQFEQGLEAEILSLETRETDPGNPNQDLSLRYWLIATKAEFEAGNLTTARYYYQKLLTDYPEDLRVYLAKQALIRLDRIEQEVRAVK